MKTMQAMNVIKTGNGNSPKQVGKQAGRSAIEMVAVVALIGVLTAAGAYAVNQMFEAHTLSSAVEQTIDFKARLLSEYSDELNFATLTTAYAIKHFVPKDAVSGTTVVSKFGGEVTFGPRRSYGLAGLPNSGFTITLSRVPKGEVCKAFVKRTAVAFRHVWVNSKWPKMSGVFDKGQLNAGCDDPGTQTVRVQFIGYKKW